MDDHGSNIFYWVPLLLRFCSVTRLCCMHVAAVPGQYVLAALPTSTQITKLCGNICALKRQTFVQNYFIYINQMAPSDRRAAMYMHRPDWSLTCTFQLRPVRMDPRPPQSTLKGQGHLKIKLLQLICHKISMFFSVWTKYTGLIVPGVESCSRFLSPLLNSVY